MFFHQHFVQISIFLLPKFSFCFRYIYPIGGVLIIGGIVGCILCCVYGCCCCQKPQQPGAVIFAGGQAPPPANNDIIAGSKQHNIFHLSFQNRRHIKSSKYFYEKRKCFMTCLIFSKWTSHQNFSSKYCYEEVKNQILCV